MSINNPKRTFYRANCKPTNMKLEYKKNGFFVVEGLFSQEEIDQLRDMLMEFHKSWVSDNLEFYRTKALNSAYITGEKYLNCEQRRSIFRFIGSKKIADILEMVIPSHPAFMNTQLFFNPLNTSQKNYWHRDLQYLGKSTQEQKKLLRKTNVIHFRIPVKPEPGLELVPGSHKHWDSNEELDVRTESNGRRCFEDLPTGKKVTVNVGDLLVFSANMIHRGLYGLDRMTFDIIFCDSDPELVKYVEHNCLPGNEELLEMDTPNIFLNAIKLKANNKKIPLKKTL
jgi:ectoine hydroxylase-related dioxygenase (phytanoyl-CoA dioxygenase family)